MRQAALFTMALLLAGSAFAQRGGFRGGGGVHGAPGHGGIGVPRGGGLSHGGAFRGGGYVHGGFGNFGFRGGYYGRSHYGRGYYGGGYYGGGYYGWPFFFGGYYSSTWYDPFYMPYVGWSGPYIGGGYYGSGYYGGYYAPPVTVVEPYSAQPAPVVIEQPVRIYSAPQPRTVATEPEAQADADTRDRLYLIAFKDNVIRAAYAYWVEAGTLHYVDMDHSEQKAPLGRVDRELSRQLNQERRVPFRLPD